MTLPRFDYLAQLHRFHEEQPEGLRMNALSRYLMVTGGNVTEPDRRAREERLRHAPGRPRGPALVPHRADAARHGARSSAWPRSTSAGSSSCSSGLDADEGEQLHALLGHLRLSLTRRLQDDKTR